jgi:hypothetical protein
MKLKSLIDFGPTKDCVPMTQEESEMFVTLCMNEIHPSGKPWPPIDDSAPAVLRIMQSRLEWAGIESAINHPLKLFIACISDRPGVVVMWAYTLAHMLEKKNDPSVILKISDLAAQFPMGFPNEDAKNECWDAQKGHAHNVPGDNLMDQLEYWQPESKKESTDA